MDILKKYRQISFIIRKVTFLSVKDGAEGVEGLLAEDGGVVEAVVLVAALDLLHVLGLQLESEEVNVLLDPLRVLRLGNHGASSLNAPAQDDLSCSLACKKKELDQN